MTLQAIIREDLILNSLPDSIVVVNSANQIIYVNNAAEQLFFSGAKLLLSRKLEEIVAFDSPLVSVVNQSRRNKTITSEYDIMLSSPKYSGKRVDIHVSPLIEGDGDMVVQLQERSIAQKISQQLSHRGAARSVAGMASVLAHEIKNPLSGIRGSAQLLEQGICEDDKDLTRLIVQETDRICGLVDRMEVFSDNKPVAAEDINIHSVLEHVRMLAQNGFGRHVTFREIYDPSIPSARGDKGQLIQVFLNLIKNAVEAVSLPGGEVTLTTAYRHGVRVAVAGSKERMHLPLEICVIDNGSGIADDLKPHLFDPFVTTKPSGTGLGLALVAKIVGDHGGIIECDTSQTNTIFRVLLPSFCQD
ncbi:MAG: two-component sensor histidine kinase [Alphaproteobacteria bacterium]|nr:MAG: two-component sensor histidine kinase [Alphaproteobacteria bacterium]